MAHGDDLLDCSNIAVFPDLKLEAWESCTFNPDIPDSDRLKEIVKYHGNILFQPIDLEGLKMEPLTLKVNPAVNFGCIFCTRENSSPTQGIAGSIRF